MVLEWGLFLVERAFWRRREEKRDEIVLETEITNVAVLGSYDGLGFMNDKMLCKYYLKRNDAFELKLWFHFFDLRTRIPWRRGERGSDQTGE